MSDAKKYLVCVTFPNFKAAHAQQTAQAQGGDWRVCINRAMEEIMQRPHVKGRHVECIRIVATPL